ncbi:hypothetical protein PV08_06280 [Exophiala spinifera]|uniref:Uncharacterized protein n=1 Tax=Exophiala spinifera TaxID=91928 RepID=A0A0D2BY40_9EURO|nr:uncharacterized protein PV08_06280 [Exophiala spinifera]KIW16229.1 hypothetical protein PV08_06280 [Exophiala spinifera]
MAAAARVIPPKLSRLPSYNLDKSARKELTYDDWKAAQDLRAMVSPTKFTLWRDHHRHRMSQHEQYKENSKALVPTLQEMLETRLSSACDCHACSTRPK